MVVVEFRVVSMVYLYNHTNRGPLDYWTLEFRELKRFAFYCIALRYTEGCIYHDCSTA